LGDMFDPMVLLGTAKSAPQACFACMHVQQRRRNMLSCAVLSD